MSQFLPEAARQPQPDNGYLKTPTSEAGNLTSGERQLLQRLTGSPQDFPKEFKTWLTDYILVNVVPLMPVSQMAGFRSFTASHSEVQGSNTTSSTTYVNLGTVGPELSGLADGEYVFMFGCNYDSTAGGDGYMALSINGSTPADAKAAYIRPTSANRYNLARATQETVKGAVSNLVTAKYRVSSGTNGFENRWLVAQRVGNA